MNYYKSNRQPAIQNAFFFFFVFSGPVLSTSYILVHQEKNAVDELTRMKSNSEVAMSKL